MADSSRHTTVGQGSLYFTGKAMSEQYVDGKTIKGDPRRAKGLHANAAMRTDPTLPNTCLSDPGGASAVLYDTGV